MYTRNVFCLQKTHQWLLNKKSFESQIENEIKGLRTQNSERRWYNISWCNQGCTEFYTGVENFQNLLKWDWCYLFITVCIHLLDVFELLSLSFAYGKKVKLQKYWTPRKIKMDFPFRIFFGLRYLLFYVFENKKTRLIINKRPNDNNVSNNRLYNCVF